MANKRFDWMSQATLQILCLVLAVGSPTPRAQAAKASKSVPITITVTETIGLKSAAIGRLSMPTTLLKSNPAFTGSGIIDFSVQQSPDQTPLGTITFQAKDFGFEGDHRSIRSSSLKNVLNVVGVGTVNGKTDYGFLMQVMEAGQGADKDKIRLRIFTKPNHIVVFDGIRAQHEARFSAGRYHRFEGPRQVARAIAHRFTPSSSRYAQGPPPAQGNGLQGTKRRPSPSSAIRFVPRS